VHATADGHVVVLHDRRSIGTTDGRGPVSAHALADGQRLDAGSTFVAPDGSHPYRGRASGADAPRAPRRASDVPLNIEIKQDDPPIVDRVLADLDAFGARERTLPRRRAPRHHGGDPRRGPDMLTSASAAEAADFVFRVRDGRLDDYGPPPSRSRCRPSTRARRS
jgi:glycerophosphoryl diester phosphodiesterase